MHLWPWLLLTILVLFHPQTKALHAWIQTQIIQTKWSIYSFTNKPKIISYAHTHTHTHRNTLIQVPTKSHNHTHTTIHTHIYIQTYTQTYTQSYIHTYIYKHTITHTHDQILHINKHVHRPKKWYTINNCWGSEKNHFKLTLLPN